MQFTYVEHTFMSNHTIRAAIRLYNGHTSDESLIDTLLQQFCEVNNNVVPRVGQRYKIPVAIQHNQ